MGVKFLPLVGHVESRGGTEKAISKKKFSTLIINFFIHHYDFQKSIFNHSICSSLAPPGADIEKFIPLFAWLINGEN